MADPSTATLAWRVGVTLFVVVMPTVMFFQLLRFLEWLRDDELIASIAERGDLEAEEGAELLAALEVESSSGAGGGGTLVRCRSCGHRNARTATYCVGCLERIDD